VFARSGVATLNLGWSTVHPQIFQLGLVL